MKFKNLFAALFLSAFLFTGCDKKEEAPTPDPVTQPVNQQTTPGMSAKVSNADWTAAIPMAMLQNGDLIVGGTNLAGHSMALNAQGSNISQPGTYTAIAVYTEAGQDTTLGPAWVNPSASITISKLDLTAKKVSGTFTFTGFPAPGTNATGIKTVSNGVFTDIPLQ